MSAVVERANPRAIPGPLLGLCGLLVLIGLVSFFVGLGRDPQTAWLAFHVNYLYFGALTFERVTTNVRSDNGQAKVLRMNWARQYSPTFNRFAGALMLLGALAATYLAVVGIVALYGLVQ